jgi:hypothetical protein
MAGRTQGEKIDDLMRVTGTLTSRIDNLAGEVGIPRPNRRGSGWNSRA